MVVICCNNVYNLLYCGFVMVRFGRGDLNPPIRRICDSVRRLSEVKYSVCDRGGNATALFRPVRKVKVFVGPYSSSHEKVDVVFHDGSVFEDYASVLEIMGRADDCDLYGRESDTGLRRFMEAYEKNKKSRTKVDIDMHIGRGGLNWALMYMFKAMDHISDSSIGIGPLGMDRIKIEHRIRD